MKKCSTLSSVSPLFKRFVSLCCVYAFLVTNVTWGSDTNSKDQLVESIQQRIRDLNTRMKSMGASNLPPVDTRYNSEPLSEKISYEETKPNSIRRHDKSTKKVTTSRKSSFEPNTGFYFVPFGGLAVIDDIDWKLPGVPASIKSNKGHSLGASFGYRWKYFYLEERISYAEAELDGAVIAGALLPTITGKVSNLSFQQSFGLNFNFNEWSGIQIGLGGGLSKKEVQMGASHEEDWVFSYDGTIGLFFQPSGFFRGGINYRWLRSEDLDQFSGTDMHLIELALGLQF